MQIMDGASPFAADGDRVGVVLSHGFTGTPSSMVGLGRACAERGWTVRVPRLPGHGTRWQDLNRTEWQDWASEVDQVCREVIERCDTVVVAGLSMGGTLATLMAQRHHEIDGLFLINPAFVMKDPRLLALPVLHRVVPSIPAIAGDIKKPGEHEEAYGRTPLRALYSQTKLWRAVTDALPDLHLPVVLCHSREDHVVPPACSELFLERVGSKDVRDVVLENSYHVATLDNDAPLVESELLTFVERLAARVDPAAP